MKTVSYVLGSGILDNPYVLPAFLFLLLACLSASMACRILEKANKEKEYLVIILSAICLVCILVCFFYLYEGAESQRRSDNHVEKMKFENHDYMLFNDRGIIHAPVCEYRRGLWKHSQ